VEGRVAALKARVSELEKRVRRSEQDAAAARVLAGGGSRRDRDECGDPGIPGTEHARAQRDARVSDGPAVAGRWRACRMRRGFTGMRDKLDAAAAGQQQIVGLLNTVMNRGEDS